MTSNFQDLLDELTEATRNNRDKGTQFEKLIANYQQHVFAPVDKLEHLDQAPRAWELRSDYLKALESLRAAVVMFEVEPDVDL